MSAADVVLVEVVLERQDVPRQARTIAKLAGISVDDARVALERLRASGRAERDAFGCWVRPDDAPRAYPASWRARIEAEIEEHRRRGKTPRREPARESDWIALYAAFPQSHYAAWYVLTGRAVRRSQ